MTSIDPAPTLAAARIQAAEAPERSLVMLHGIYGRGRNWQGIARSLVAARPEYACWLVDLPYHGGSPAGVHGPTVDGIATDAVQWLERTGIAVDAVLGHSYGGKVALAMARRLPDTPLQVWIIDSTPEIKPPSGDAWQMLQIIRRLPSRLPSRDAATAAIMAGGFPLGVAQWMGTNLVRADGGFAWRLDFEAMELLLQDFFETDLWDVVEHPAPGHELHFLKASASRAMSDDAVRRIEAIDGVRLHHRSGGHWIHAESPDVVTALLAEHLPGPTRRAPA